MNCDIYCRVIDNLGDAGVCWRLANNLAWRFDARVRLIIDRPQILWQLAPDVIGPHAWTDARVEVVRWTEPLAHTGATPQPDLVIAAFGCRPPAHERNEMARRGEPPICINLEYLSLEQWASDSNAMASVHPDTGLVEYFMFPGVSDRSAGLLREPDLASRQRRFEADVSARDEFCRILGVEPRQPGETWLMLFCYPNAPIDRLIDALARAERHCRLLIPEAIVGEVLDQRLQRRASAGAWFRFGRLRIHVIGFVAQRRFDRLLWLSDVLFVRGEDSFARALWSGRPFVWHIYAQPQAAHEPKLLAFLERYCESMEGPLADTYRALTLAWNETAGGHARDGALGAQLHRMLAQLPAWRRHAERVRDALMTQPDLAERLMTLVGALRAARAAVPDRTRRPA